jgi:hypothetical protein
MRKNLLKSLQMWFYGLVNPNKLVGIIVDDRERDSSFIGHPNFNDSGVSFGATVIPFKDFRGLEKAEETGEEYFSGDPAEFAIARDYAPSVTLAIGKAEEYAKKEGYIVIRDGMHRY